MSCGVIKKIEFPLIKHIFLKPYMCTQVHVTHFIDYLKYSGGQNY